MAGVTAMAAATEAAMVGIAMALLVAMTVVMVEGAMVPAVEVAMAEVAMAAAAAAMEVCVRTFLCYSTLQLSIRRHYVGLHLIMHQTNELYRTPNPSPIVR